MKKGKKPRRIASLVTRENLFLALILIGSFLLRAYRMGEAFGGFHGFNEAFYTLYAQKYLARPIYALLTEATDFNNPPLFSYLLFLSFKLFGVSEASARLIPILFGVLSVLFTYKVGSLLYNEQVGLISALIMAFNPACVIVGRNAQIDAVFICFVLVAAFFYLKSKEESDLKNKCLAGLFLGLGIFAKPPAILFLGVIILWEISKNWNLTWLKKSFVCFVLTSFIPISPWLLYHLRSFLAYQSNRVKLDIPYLRFIQIHFIGESFWMFSPLVFVLVVLGIGLLLYRRSHSDRLILLALAVYTFFYFFFHQHSYYLLPIVPFACIAGAAILSQIDDKKALAGLVAVAVATSIFYSILLLAGNEYGWHEFKELARLVKEQAGGEKIVVLTTQALHGSYEPLITYYLPQAELVTEGKSIKIDERRVYLLNFCSPFARPSSEGEYIIYRTMYLPTLFGYAFYQDPPNRHFFTQGRTRVAKVGSLTDFGFTRLEEPSLILRDVSSLLLPSRTGIER